MPIVPMFSTMPIGSMPGWSSDPKCPCADAPGRRAYNWTASVEYPPKARGAIMAKGNGKLRSRRVYLGVDVGGTKVQASLVAESGKIVNRGRCPTPRDSTPEQV